MSRSKQDSHEIQLSDILRTEANRMEVCPGCKYTLLKRATYCPYCGVQLTHPLWKKVGAGMLLILIGYGLVNCHLRMLDGF